MKWLQEGTVANPEIFTLWEQDQKLLTLKFHVSTNSARIEYSDKQRVFLIRKEGFFKNKIVLRNEYGIQLSKIVIENRDKILVFNKTRFNYFIQRPYPPRLSVNNYLSGEPVVNCIVPENALELNDFIQSGLVLATCWYIFIGSPTPLLQTVPG